MNKNGISKAKYCIQSEKHPQQTTLGLCSLMEHQSLVDIAISCGNNVLHAHKIVLAANSPLFREELEKNPSTEQVVIVGCDFSIIRSLIEFMYCGETIVEEDLLKYFIAAARLFQMRSLENLAMDYQLPGDMVVLPKPQFLSKKPKYPAYPFSPNMPSNSILKPLNYNNYNMNILYKPHKVKRKYRMEAEHQACVKEAQASQLAIANLKKEIASAPQANTFIIEETCTETTVENFIPHDRQNFVEVDYDNINNQIYINPQQFNQDSGKPHIIQLALPNNGQPLTADKIKNILGNEASPNVEIMFKTSDGNFVTVTDDVLQNLQKDGLQYQVIDEEGRVGEVQELELVSKNTEKMEKTGEDLSKNISSHSDIVVSSFFSDSLVDTKLTTTEANSMGNKAMEMLALHPEDMRSTFIAPSACDSQPFKTVTRFFETTTDPDEQAQEMKNEIIDVADDKSQLIEAMALSPRHPRTELKFSPDIFFADVTSSVQQEVSQQDAAGKNS